MMSSYSAFTFTTTVAAILHLSLLGALSSNFTSSFIETCPQTTYEKAILQFFSDSSFSAFFF